MKITVILLPIIFISFAASAQTDPTTENEIFHLFEFLKVSNCDFNRNGTWYNSTEAVAHLNNKYQYLLKKGLISTTDHFIERAASKSSMSGEDYWVKCRGADPVLSSDWFKKEILRYRSGPHQKPD